MMLALSLTPTPDGRDTHWDNDLVGANQPRLTWQRWVEMLRPDTPAQHRDSYDGWSTTPRSA